MELINSVVNFTRYKRVRKIKLKTNNIIDLTKDKVYKIKLHDTFTGEYYLYSYSLDLDRDNESSIHIIMKQIAKPTYVYVPPDLKDYIDDIPSLKFKYDPDDNTLTYF